MPSTKLRDGFEKAGYRSVPITWQEYLGLLLPIGTLVEWKDGVYSIFSNGPVSGIGIMKGTWWWDGINAVVEMPDGKSKTLFLSVKGTRLRRLRNKEEWYKLFIAESI